MSRRLRVAVVGLGVGEQHVQAYAARPDLFELAAICDLDPRRLERIGTEYRTASFNSDYGTMLASAKLDIVNICTPPDTHYALITEGLAAGVNVVCEKPLVGSLADIDRLEAAEAASGKRIIPIFQYRFGNGLQRLKRLVDAGLAGDALLTTIETSWLRGADYYAVDWRGKWATELGGVCLTQAIHAHDMLSYINGPVASVFANLRTRVNVIEVEDCAAIAVEMVDGSIATLSATLGSAEQISRLRFVFRNLTAESNLDAYRPSRDPWRFTAVKAEAQQAIDAMVDGVMPQEEFFERQFVHLHAALTRGGDMPVALSDARASLELITGIYHSAITGERVSFPLAPDHPRYHGWAAEPGAFARKVPK
ncbi:MAG: Gfo/Idh/MocA family protein [Bosea sp. (in: a-proteobacteria)]